MLCNCSLIHRQVDISPGKGQDIFLEQEEQKLHIRCAILALFYRRKVQASFKIFLLTIVRLSTFTFVNLVFIPTWHKCCTKIRCSHFRASGRFSAVIKSRKTTFASYKETLYNTFPSSGSRAQAALTRQSFLYPVTLCSCHPSKVENQLSGC